MSFIKVNGVNLYYEISASQKASSDAGYLIILHGGPGVSDHNLYFDFWSQFSDKIQVVFFDMRGHGQSERGDDKDWNLTQWGSDVCGLCKALNITKPIVSGVSFGGWVALSYALQYPQHYSKLILCNTEACIDNAAQIEAYTRKGGHVAGEVIQKIYETPDPSLWGDYIKYCAPYMSKNPYTEKEVKKINPNMQLYNHFYKTGQHRFNYLPRLSELDSAVLILGGTDDPEHPLQSTISMKNALTDAKVRLEIIDGAGDPVYRDFPEKTRDIIYEFLYQQR